MIVVLWICCELYDSECTGHEESETILSALVRLLWACDDDSSANGLESLVAIARETVDLNDVRLVDNLVVYFWKGLCFLV